MPYNNFFSISCGKAETAIQFSILIGETERERDNKVSRERKNGGGIGTGKAGEERENKEMRG